MQTLTNSSILRIGVPLLMLNVVGCQRQLPPPPAPPPPTVTVAQPIEQSVQRYHEYNGSLDAVEMVQVTARVEGFLNEVAFTEGDEIKQGDLLFKIDPREYAAAVKKSEADRRKANAELKQAELEESRAKELRGAAAVSDEEYERRIAAKETAAAMVMQAEAALESAQLQLGYTEIRAPIGGQISRTMVTRGNLVGQDNSLLTTIVSMDPVYVYFDAPERDLVDYQRRMQTGQGDALLHHTLPLEIGVATEDGFPHAGKIDFRENRVDVATGTVRMRGLIPNPRVPPGQARLLYPGLYARVRIPNGDPQSLPAIPEDALMTGQEGRFVYVLGDGNVVQKRTVTVGPSVWKALAATDSGWTLEPLATSSPPEKESPTDKPADKPADNPAALPVRSVVTIERGLKLTDQVVVNGLMKARPGTAVAPQSWRLKAPPPVAAE